MTWTLGLIGTKRAKPQKKRWGGTEDQAMFDVLPDSSDHKTQENPVKSYQKSRGLSDDGIIGPNTRKQLIADYMALDRTTLSSENELVDIKVFCARLW